MRRTVALLACTLTLTGAGAVQAADSGASNPVFNIMGPSTCARWPKRGSVDSAAKAVPLNWVLGFVSGVAERSDDRLFDMLQPEKIGAWLDDFCPSHPDTTLPGAARALTVDLLSQLPPLPPATPMFVPPAPVPPKSAAPDKPAAKKAAPKKAPARRASAPARKPAPKPAAAAK